LTDKFAEKGIYASEEKTGDFMRQYVMGSPYFSGETYAKGAETQKRATLRCGRPMSVDIFPVKEVKAAHIRR
jgi:hypothetical protein